MVSRSFCVASLVKGFLEKLPATHSKLNTVYYILAVIFVKLGVLHATLAMLLFLHAVSLSSVAAPFLNNVRPKYGHNNMNTNDVVNNNFVSSTDLRCDPRSRDREEKAAARARTPSQARTGR